MTNVVILVAPVRRAGRPYGSGRPQPHQLADKQVEANEGAVWTASELLGGGRAEWDGLV